MSAKERNVPVYVCAETVKFTERVALDSIAGNELAPPEELIAAASGVVASAGSGTSAVGGDKAKEAQDSAASAAESQDVLGQWRETPNLFVLNPLYDVTPAEYIDSIITELGSLPPSSAPVVQRISVGAYAGEMV